MEIVIVVEGGVVQAVFSDTHAVSVVVLDQDSDELDKATLNAMLAEETKGMVPVY